MIPDPLIFLAQFFVRCKKAIKMAKFQQKVSLPLENERLGRENFSNITIALYSRAKIH